MKKKFEIDNSFSNYKRRFCTDFRFHKSFVLKMKVACNGEYTSRKSPCTLFINLIITRNKNSIYLYL